MSDVIVSGSTQRERLVTAKEVAEHLGCDVSNVWRAAAEGRIPNPVYPTSRAARWRLSEVDAAVDATRSSAVQARAARQAKRLGCGEGPGK